MTTAALGAMVPIGARVTMVDAKESCGTGAPRSHPYIQHYYCWVPAVLEGAWPYPQTVVVIIALVAISGVPKVCA